MPTITTISQVTTSQREAVTTTARGVLSSAVTLTRRTEALSDALSTLKDSAMAEGGTFRQYVTLASVAIRDAGDWDTASADVRQAVAVVAGTSGGLSSVVVAEAVGLSQSTASRAIRAAKSAAVTTAVTSAVESATLSASDNGASDSEAGKAGREAGKAAQVKAEREAARVITRSGLSVASGRGDNATTARRGSSVHKSVTDALSALDTMADGTVSADDLRTLAVSLAEAAERVGRTMASQAAEREAAQAVKVTERDAKVTEREAAQAARKAERDAKAADVATARKVRKVRSALAVTMGDAKVADMTDAKVLSLGEVVAQAASLALAGK